MQIIENDKIKEKMYIEKPTPEIPEKRENIKY